MDWSLSIKANPIKTKEASCEIIRMIHHSFKIPWKLFRFIPIALFFLYMAFSDCCHPHKEAGAHTENGTNHKTSAMLFLEALSQVPAQNIKYIKVSYDISFQREWKVNLKMSAYVEMKREPDSYVSTFHISRPVGADLWGKFAMLVYGEHTDEYRKTVEDIESTVVEKFSFQGGKFLTDSVLEILPEKKRSIKSKGFNIVFDRKNNKVRFWENRVLKDQWSSINYTNEQGPLTAFFNYLLFEMPGTEFVGINIQRQNKIAKKKKGSAVKSIVSHKIRVGRNNSGTHEEYPYAVSLMCNNFFDIIYGTIIYYDMTLLPGTPLKVPDAALVKGIINKSKFREKHKRLRGLKKRNLTGEKLKKEMKDIEAMDILSAENVRVTFNSAEVLY